MGSGTFGFVIKAHDNFTNKIVAIKRVKKTEHKVSR